MKKFMFLWHVWGVLVFFIYLVWWSFDSNCSMMVEWKMDNNEIWDVGCVMVVDGLSSLFLFTVFLVSFMVFNYSVHYFSYLEGFNKFIITLFLFVMSMCILCLSPSMFWVMVGWDGLGLTSFGLIIFYQNWSSFSSGLFTFLMNRMGDMFMISVIVMLSSCNMLKSVSMSSAVQISALLLLGAMTKSAQLPFSSWLPLAMAAPTPVSSLVHSSTLVTAGIYLLIRFESLFPSEVLQALKVVSIMTIVYAGVSALCEVDLKKVVALSTLTHLGIMTLYVSIGSVTAATTHLVFHAFFKSALFMLSGVVIHYLGFQDIRMLQITSSLKMMFLIVLSSMAGLPFLTGFYSKEVMVMLAEDSLLTLVSFLLGVMLTSGYSVRLMVLIFKSPNFISDKKDFTQVSEGLVSASVHGFMISVLGGSMLLWVVMPITMVMGYNLSCSVLNKLLIIVSLAGGVLLGLNWVNLLAYVPPSMWYLTDIINQSSSSVLKFMYLMGRKSDVRGVQDGLVQSLELSVLSLKDWLESLLGVKSMMLVKWLFFMLIMLIMVK
uniref:NADH-ubiquinone oxidoreductase chain 5 n=1 Tax=Haematopinus suis TaxID=511927 RepID=R9ZRP2_9NEOP|nr:NADH dehydrogenase subunit 5 [Haematopinus suis]